MRPYILIFTTFAMLLMSGPARVYATPVADLESELFPPIYTKDLPENTASFHVWQQVAGEYIRYKDGSEAFNCFANGADQDGTVRNGVVRPLPGDKAGLSICKFAKPGGSSPSPTGTQSIPPPVTDLESELFPPIYTIDLPEDKANFHVWQQVAGNKIVYRNGSEAFNCFVNGADQDGTVFHGVVRPRPGDKAGLPVCHFQRPLTPTSQPTMQQATPSPTATPTAGQTATATAQATATPVPTPNPDCATVDCKERQSTAENGDKPVHFEKGDSVIGGTITLTGQAPVGPCYYYSAPASGDVNKGAVHPYKQEVLDSGVKDLTKSTCP